MRCWLGYRGTDNEKAAVCCNFLHAQLWDCSHLAEVLGMPLFLPTYIVKRIFGDGQQMDRKKTLEEMKTYLQKDWKVKAPALLFLLMLLFLGGAIGQATVENRRVPGLDEAWEDPAAAASGQALAEVKSWGLGFDREGKRPTGTATMEELAKYNAYYAGDEKEKVIYLTFDCGYENGNTEAILDALKKHSATGVFFVVGHYLESAPELVKRMVEEGHTVGNHTYHHPDMSAISDKGAFEKELEDVKAAFQEVTSAEMPMFYRPPQGKYSTENLQMAKDLGYATIFWSLAYMDWDANAQPTREEALKKLTERIHPGAIVLLHTTSKTNGEIMEELLTKWEEMGYRFGKLEDLVKE